MKTFIFACLFAGFLIWGLQGIPAYGSIADSESLEESMTMAAINDAGGIEIEDKLFYDFVVSSESLSSDLEQFIIVPIPGAAPGIDIQFPDDWAVSGATLDAQISFSVKILNAYPDYFISGANMSLVAYSFANVQNGTIGISENIHPIIDGEPNFKLDPIADFGVFAGMVNGALSENLNSSVIFSVNGEETAEKNILVEKDIIFAADDGTVKLENISQTFDQIYVPEPATFSMILLGSSIFLFGRKR